MRENTFWSNSWTIAHFLTDSIIWVIWDWIWIDAVDANSSHEVQRETNFQSICQLRPEYKQFSHDNSVQLSPYPMQQYQITTTLMWRKESEKTVEKPILMKKTNSNFIHIPILQSDFEDKPTHPPSPIELHFHYLIWIHGKSVICICCWFAIVFCCYLDTLALCLFVCLLVFCVISLLNWRAYFVLALFLFFLFCYCIHQKGFL